MVQYNKFGNQQTAVHFIHIESKPWLKIYSDSNQTWINDQIGTMIEKSLNDQIRKMIEKKKKKKKDC